MGSPIVFGMSLNNNADGRKQQRARLDRDLFFPAHKPQSANANTGAQAGQQELLFYAIGFIILSINATSSSLKSYFLYNCWSISAMDFVQFMSELGVKSWTGTNL